MTAGEFGTVDALMAHYAAGILPVPARVLVEAHLEMKPASRRIITRFEAVAGNCIEAIEPTPMIGRDETLKAIFTSDGAGLRQPDQTRATASNGLPRAIRDLIGKDLDNIPWKRKLPGFKEYSLGKMDGCDVEFFWIRPGRAIPSHTHEGFELSLVLTGAFSDKRGRFGKGDISVADEAIDHRPIAEEGDPCIVFAVTDAPLKLTGSFGRRLGDLIG